jgi:GDPmannose 4,6-dehydratase
MWLMLQQDKPDDFVIATGVDRTIREFCEVAFACADLDWEQYVTIDERFLRPAEVEILRGDPAKAKRVLNWEPEVSFEEMVRLMVERDLELISREQ